MLKMTTVIPTTVNLNSTVQPTNSTAVIAGLANKALAYVTGSTTGIIIGVLILVALIILVVVLVVVAVKGLKRAKERALSKLKDFRKSQERALDMIDAVPDVNVSTVQPTGSRRELKNLGDIKFSLRYDEESNDLVVTVHECNDLPIKYTGGTMYKYVEIEMFPFHRMTSNKPKTRYIRNDFSPVFEEEVRIKMTSEEVKDQKLYLHVCDFNQISPRDLIGSYHVNLENTKVKSKNSTYEGSLEWIESVRGAERGDIDVILRYFRGEGELLVEIKEIKGLKPAIGRRFTSAYVKVHLVHGSKQIYENKTKIRRKNFEPTFNKRFLIKVPSSIINEVNIIIRVKDSPYVGRKVILGEVCIGGDAVGSYFHHWKLALEKDQEIEMWHCLEMLNIVPGKTNLQTAMKTIQVYESTEDEEVESEEEGLFGMLPNIDLPFGMGGMFSGSDGKNESGKEEKDEEKKTEEKKKKRKESLNS